MKRLEVFLTTSARDERHVGTLADDDGRIYFEYDQTFVDAGFNPSPFRLPFSARVYEHTHAEFGPLPGLFDDSLPDGWGLLLMDRGFRDLGLDPATVSPLDRLAWLGSSTMGALTYRPPTDHEPRDAALVSLHELAANARAVLSGEAAQVLPALMRLGGSPGGARPKVLVNYHEGTDVVVSGEDPPPTGYGAWLVKFAGRGDDDDAGAVEFAYSQMARAAGIQMPPTRLFETAEGDRFFGVSRFDRSGDRRVHVHTFGNLIESNFRVPGCDYAQLLRLTTVLTRSEGDVRRAFRLAAFNCLAHNRDDHVKNFAFLARDDGTWTLAPAYDLTYSPGPGGEHSMTFAGEGRRPTTGHLLTLASRESIPDGEARRIVEEVRDAVRRWPDFAARAGVSHPPSLDETAEA